MTTLYKDMSAEEQAKLEHEVLDCAKKNDIEEYMKVIKKHNAEELMTTMRSGRFSAAMQFVYWNNLSALQQMEAYAPEWFNNSWLKPMDEAKRAKEMLNTPRIVEESAKKAAEETLQKYPKTLNEVLQEVDETTKEATKEDLLVRLKIAMMFIPSTTILEPDGEPAAKKAKTK